MIALGDLWAQPPVCWILKQKQAGNQQGNGAEGDVRTYIPINPRGRVRRLLPKSEHYFNPAKTRRP
jgi:hypothetical protein